MNRSRRQKAMGWLFVVGTLVSGTLVSTALGACGSARYGTFDLKMTAMDFHQHLRWGRLGPASKSVNPELRKAFLHDWNARAKSIQIQDIEVLDMVEEDNGDVMVLTIKMAWVEVASQRLRSDIIEERWLRSDNGWVLQTLPTMPS